MRRSNSPESGSNNLINLPAVPRTSNKLRNTAGTIKSGCRREPAEYKNNDIFSLTPESLFKKFESLSREISNFFEGLFDGMPEMTDIQDIRVSQADQNVIINAKIPGVLTDNLDVNIGEDYIRLSGKQQSSNEYRNLDNNQYRAQKSYIAFFRTIPLPVKVNYNQAKVEYNEDGLSISIPKLKP